MKRPTITQETPEPRYPALALLLVAGAGWMFRRCF